MQRHSGKKESVMGAYEMADFVGPPNEDHGCKFEATLLAMAGHDLRQPLQGCFRMSRTSSTMELAQLRVAST
jgi:hypothetical protein